MNDNEEKLLSHEIFIRHNRFSSIASIWEQINYCKINLY